MAEVLATMAIDDNVLTVGQANRTLIFILACEAFAACSTERNRSRMLSSWDRLTVLEKKALKHAVRIPRRSLRTRTLLKLAGVEERAQPIHGKDDVRNHVVRAKHVRFDVSERADVNDTKTSSKARGNHARAKHVRFDFVNRADVNATNTSSEARGATATRRASL